MVKYNVNLLFNDKAKSINELLSSVIKLNLIRQFDTKYNLIDDKLNTSLNE